MGRTRQDGIVRGRPRKEPAPPPPVLVGVNTQSHNPDLPDKTEETHSETPKETADTNDSDNVPISETPLNDGRDASHAAAVTVEELVEVYWSGEHGQGQMFERLHCRVEPDLDTINTEAALDRLLENEVVRDIPRAEGAGMKHLTTR